MAEHLRRVRGSGVVAVVALALVAGALGGGQARASDPGPEFTFAPERGLVGSFAGFGGQLNQHVYADISGPPPGLADLEARIVSLQPQFVRIFFNSTAWTYPDRMASFVRTVDLAQRVNAQINVTWQGGTFGPAQASRFAEVVADLLQNSGVPALWVTLFNEPNSTKQPLAQYELAYRLLDAELRGRGLRDRVRFMGGDLVATTSPLGQSQKDWFWYLATRMGDLLDAWSVHVYWNFWDSGKIDARLLTQVRTIFSAIPEGQRRPLYVTEFGLRGLMTVEGEPNFQPGLAPDGTGISATNTAAFQEAWFMIRATQLGYSATAKWDLYQAKYDNSTQDYSAVGPGADGWPVRPVYNLLRLLTTTTRPGGGSIVDMVPSPGADPAKLVTAYVSPASNITILGLDKAGGAIATTSHAPVAYSIGGLPPSTLFRLVVWNADGSGQNVDIGYLSTDPAGTIAFSAPLDAVFALTDTPTGSVSW